MLSSKKEDIMQMTYYTNRLVLSILPNSEADKVLTFYENNKAFFEPWEPERDPNFYTISYQRITLSIEYNLMFQSKALRFWVFQQDNLHNIIGTVNFYNILRGPYSTCQLGYKFDQKYTGKGYALESIQAGMNILYQEYHIHRIEASIMPTNLPSIRLIETLGFSYEGLAVSSIKVGVQWQDHARYAYVNND